MDTRRRAKQAVNGWLADWPLSLPAAAQTRLVDDISGALEEMKPGYREPEPGEVGEGPAD